MDRLDLRYPMPPVSSCNIRAGISVLFEKKRTKGLLYYISMNQCGFFHWCHLDYYTLLLDEDEDEYHGDLRGPSYSSYGGVNSRDKPHEKKVMYIVREKNHDAVEAGYVRVS